MSTKATKEAVAICVQARMPALVWGGPGTGKTTFIGQLGKYLGEEVETIIASIREPSDFGGLPVISNGGGVRLEPPVWAHRLAERGRGILFIDEINTAPPAVQAALLRVIQEGAAGDIVLPKAVARIAAANPTDIAAGGWELAAPLANRFIHFDWPRNTAAWIDGMIEGFDSDFRPPILPKDWEDQIPAMQSLVASYIQHRTDMLYIFPDSEERSGRAWPSPRTWDYAATLLAACRAAGGTVEHEILLLAGAVGDAPAGEFQIWLNELDLPNPEDLLSKPSSFKGMVKGKLGRSDKMFACLSSVTTAVLNDLTDDRWKAAWQILATAASESKTPDVAAFAAKALAKRLSPELTMPTAELKEFLPILREAGLLTDLNE